MELWYEHIHVTEIFTTSMVDAGIENAHSNRQQTKYAAAPSTVLGWFEPASTKVTALELNPSETQESVIEARDDDF